MPKSNKKEYNQKYQKENKESISAQKREYYQLNKEKIKQKRKEYVARNRDKVLESLRNHYKDNIEQYKTYFKIYRKTHRGLRNSLEAKRHAAKLKRTPKWLTEEQLNEIKKIYDTARALTESTGIEHHVDHQAPLQGKNISGLHVPWNLQILTESENSKKHNKF